MKQNYKLAPSDYDYMINKIYGLIRPGIYLVFFSLFLGACANPVSPTGGPIDEEPPKIDSTKSTPNLQTNFDQRSFELTFDEWVVLEDVLQQVVVSPLLDFEVSLKKKTVTFNIKEGDTLRANTTYTVNFGEAVKDLTEKNPAEDLRFVFSTGSFLDSLSITGQLIDVETREPVEEAYFMLYDILADSVVRTERPYYFGRTDERGEFSIYNLRSGTFKAFALKGTGPSGYIYSNPGAQIGFPDTNLVIAPGRSPRVEILMFTETRALRYLNNATKTFGQVKLVFNQEDPINAPIQIPERLNLSYQTETVKDTLKIWYNDLDEQGWPLFIQKDTTFDTIRIAALSRNTFLENARLSLAGGVSETTNRLTPRAPISLEWNHPITNIDPTQIVVLKDSIVLPIDTVYLVSNSLRETQIEASLQQDSTYQLQLLPGAVTDLFGLQNDTIELTYRVSNMEDFGNIILQFNELDSTLSYIMELRQGAQIVDTLQIKKKKSLRYQKKLLRPTKYTVRLIEDWNDNGVWDTGSYDEKRQAELIYTKELEQLRANWDLEEVIMPAELKIVNLKNVPTTTNNRSGGSNRRN